MSARRKAYSVLLCAALLVLAFTYATFGLADVCLDTPGALIHDRQKVFDGFVLFDGSDGKTHLITLPDRNSIAGLIVVSLP